MTKFTYEQKLAAVKLYLEGQSLGEIVKKFNIGEHAQLLFWVKQYKRHGSNIFNPKKIHEEYSGEFKLKIKEILLLQIKNEVDLHWLKSKRKLYSLH